MRLMKNLIFTVVSLLLWIPAFAQDQDKIEEIIDTGNLQALEKLPGADKAFPDYKNSQGASALHIAVRSNKIDIIEYLLKHGAKLDAEDNDGRTPLIYTAVVNNIHAMEYLIKRGADINKCDTEKVPPLIFAIYKKNIDAVKFLLEKGAKVNVFTTKHATPLKYAVVVQDFPIVKLLLKHGAVVDAPDKNGTTPLMLACNKGNIEIIECLIAHGADLHAKNVAGSTPITFVDDPKVAELLKQKGIDLDVVFRAGSPLMIAAYNGNLKMIDYLLRHGAKVNQRDHRKSTALMLACIGGRLEAVKKLVAAGAKVNDHNINYQTPLTAAALANNLPIVKYLLENKANPNVMHKKGGSPLLIAVKNNNLEMVKLLLAHGAKVNLPNKGGMTALYVATINNLSEMIKLLLKHGADPNIPDAENCLSPLMFAIAMDKPAAAKALLTSPVIKVNHKNRDGATALMACANKPVEYAELLLKHGADPNLQDNNGVCALLLAMREKNYDLMRLLLKNKADPDLKVHQPNDKIAELLTKLNKDKNGKELKTYIIFFAVIDKDLEVMKILLDNGAKVNVFDNIGFTPLDIAVQGKWTDRIKLLRQYGAKTTAELKEQEKQKNENNKN